jgi:hypothetical protein
MTNALRYAPWQRILDSSVGEGDNVKFLDELPGVAGPGPTYVVVDAQTFDWNAGRLRNKKEIPACWEPVQKIVAVPAKTAGAAVTSAVVAGLNLAPDPLRSLGLAQLEPLYRVKPATVYEVPAGCVTPFIENNKRAAIK